MGRPIRSYPRKGAGYRAQSLLGAHPRSSALWITFCIPSPCWLKIQTWRCGYRKLNPPALTYAARCRQRGGVCNPVVSFAFAKELDCRCSDVKRFEPPLQLRIARGLKGETLRADPQCNFNTNRNFKRLSIYTY